MSDEEGGGSSRSSASSASSAGSEQFARDVATMTDKIEAAEAATRLTKQQYTAANQSHKGTATNLTTKTKAQKEAKAALVARDAQVKAASDDPLVIEIAEAIKATGRVQDIIQRLTVQEITGEKAIEYIDLAMLQAAIVLKSDMAERAAYEHAKDSAAQAQQAFDESKEALLGLETKKKEAEDTLEQLRKDHVELVDPVLDGLDRADSSDSLTGGASLFSGITPATDTKPPPRKRRATDGLIG